MSEQCFLCGKDCIGTGEAFLVCCLSCDQCACAIDIVFTRGVSCVTLLPQLELQLPSLVSKTWPKVQTPTTRLWTSWRKISRAPCAVATTRRPSCSPAITTTVGRVSSRWRSTREGGPSPAPSVARTHLFRRAASNSCRARSSWRG